MQTITKNNSNTLYSCANNETKFNGSTNNHSNIETRSVTRTTDDIHNDIDDSTGQVNNITKELGITDTDYCSSKTAYYAYKAEANKLQLDINNINKKINILNKEVNCQNEATVNLKEQLDDLSEKLSTAIKSMEHHKKKLACRKTESFISHKVCSVIKQAIPNYEVQCPRTRSIRDRLASVLRSVKTILKKCFSLKGLVTAIKIVAIILIMVAAFSIVGGMFAGLVALMLLADFIIVCPLTIGVFGLCNALYATISSGRQAAKEFFPNNDHERNTLEEIKELAKCLTIKGYPDIPTLTQLITTMKDNSFLSGDNEYDSVNKDLITYLQEHSSSIHHLIDCAKSHDNCLSEDMTWSLNNKKALSLS